MAHGRKTGGRVAGTPNKTTAAVKEAILHAFDELGGTSYLVDIGRKDPRTFCSLLSRVLPAPSSSEDGELTLADLVKLSYERQRAGLTPTAAALLSAGNR